VHQAHKFNSVCLYTVNVLVPVHPFRDYERGKISIITATESTSRIFCAVSSSASQFQLIQPRLYSSEPETTKAIIALAPCIET
jgi:hypothetical protein